MTKEENQTQDQTFKLFAEFLQAMRNQCDDRLLALCRQIEKIEINESIVKLVANENILEELGYTKDYYLALKNFFLSHDLSVSIKHFISDEIEKQLREWFGKKLSVEE